MNFDGEIFSKKSKDIILKPSSTVMIDCFDSPLKNEDEFIYAELLNDNNEVLSSNIYQWLEDKDIHYKKAHVKIEKIDVATFKISVDSFTKDICLASGDIVFSDNYFTLFKNQSKIVSADKDIEIKDISIICVNNID